jgi:hypothetical protein
LSVIINEIWFFLCVFLSRCFIASWLPSLFHLSFHVLLFSHSFSCVVFAFFDFCSSSSMCVFILRFLLQVFLPPSPPTTSLQDSLVVSSNSRYFIPFSFCLFCLISSFISFGSRVQLSRSTLYTLFLLDYFLIRRDNSLFSLEVTFLRITLNLFLIPCSCYSLLLNLKQDVRVWSCWESKPPKVYQSEMPFTCIVYTTFKEDHYIHWNGILMEGNSIDCSITN